MNDEEAGATAEWRNCRPGAQAAGYAQIIFFRLPKPLKCCSLRYSRLKKTAVDSGRDIV